MKRVFYEKVGRRYKPVSVYDSDMCDSFTKGAHLVVCDSGFRIVRSNINPACAPLIAASLTVERALADSIVDASAMKPGKTPVTQEQADAWHALARAFGDDLYCITRPGANDIASVAMKALQVEADKLLTNPTVKAAYEQFLLVCALSKEEQ